MAVGVYTQTLIIEHLAVRTLTTTHKEDKVVLGSKLRYVWHTIGHRTTDGIKTLKCGIGRDMSLDIFDDAIKFIERLSGLRIQIYVAREIKLCNLVATLDDDGL